MDAETAQEFIENPDKVLRALRDGILSESEFPTLKSPGRTGAEWMHLLSDSSVHVTNYAEDVLTQDEFNDKHATDVREYNPELIRGDEFDDDERTIKNIRRVGTEEFGLVEPPADLAPLLAKKLSVDYLKRLKEEHGIRYLVIMHEVIIDSDGNPRLLYFGRVVDKVGLGARWGECGCRLNVECGLLFLSRE
jgi:hypothetical protein